MSADNGLTLVKENLAYKLKAWQGESEGKVIFETNDIFQALACAEMEMKQAPSYEYGLYLHGFEDDEDN
jgi:hypothetical protein